MNANIEPIISKVEIDITPDISLFPKIGKSGYTLTQSVAELVDNSIDARITGKKLIVNIVMHSDAIIIKDNAKGMSKNEASRALKLGYSEKENALGEFGLGLKSACTSLGEQFILRAFPLNSKTGYQYTYDEKEWLSRGNKNDWRDELQIYEKSKKKHGTEIKIEKLKKRFNRQRKKEVLNDFSKRFAPFIKSGEVEILVNQNKCIPTEPTLTDEGKINFEISLKEDRKIYGWYGLMKKGSDKGNYGFTTFRRGRMITYYDKIGIPHHPTVSRIIGEIHLDHVPVSHNKKEFESESEEYQEAIDLLTNEFKEIVKKARQTSLAAKVDKVVKDKTDVWTEAIVKAYHLDIKELLESADAKRKKTQDPRDPIGSVIIEKRNSPLHETIKRIVDKRERSREPRDKKQTVIAHFININGKNYDINHDFARLGDDAGWMEYDYFEERGTIEVFTNQDFPAYAATSDLPFYAAIHIAEAISEIVVKLSNFTLDKKDEIKQKIIRRASEFLEEFK